MMEFIYDNQLNILTCKTNGQVDKIHVLEFYKYIASEDKFPRSLRTLIDAGDVAFDFGLNDLSELVKELLLALKKYASIREAILVTRPHETVIATLFSERIKEPNYTFKVFSTRSAAIRWLTT